ncbi:MAG: hypothetical protein JWN31_659 [Frankiales bacterium]|nr:hypothetical protein [Frankiales bacterium]
MRVRMIIGSALAVVLAGIAVPALGAPTVPAACVVVSSNGAHLQLGLAPNGPDDCIQLP